MKSILALIEKINSIKKEIGYKAEAPISDLELSKFIDQFNNKYGFTPPKAYLQILALSNGINFNGTFFYGVTESNNLDFIDSNLNWESDFEFKNFIFYADSEQYLFVQNIQNKLFSFHSRDNFESILFSTTDEELFFQIILECALGEDIESKYL